MNAHPQFSEDSASADQASPQVPPPPRLLRLPEVIDRVGDIVLTSGFRDDHFKGNPIVTINHDYTRSPVGRSLWRRKVRDGDRLGIKAKTIYPARPEEWKEPIWPSDTAWALVKSGLMAGKSIGFIATKSHVPTEDEIRRRPELQKVRRIVDEWYLLEYCCCWLPVNPEACVDAVSKSLVTPEALSFVGQELPKAHTPGRLPEIIPFRPLAEIEKAVQKQFQKLDLASYIKNGWKQAYDKAKGAA